MDDTLGPRTKASRRGFDDSDQSHPDTSVEWCWPGIRRRRPPIASPQELSVNVQGDSQRQLETRAATGSAKAGLSTARYVLGRLALPALC